VLLSVCMIDQAPQQLQLASVLYPADAAIRHNLAIAYMHRGEFEAARHELSGLGVAAIK
jgi:Flp pilus assembly protein TadD